MTETAAQEARGWQRQLVHDRLAADPDWLRPLTERRPGRVVLDVAGCYAVIAVAFALLAVSTAWWVALVSFVLIGNRQYALSVLAHDGKHGNLFRTPRWNDRFAILFLCAPIGVDFHGERANHRAHHRAVGTSSDPDRHLYVLGNKIPRRQFALFLSGLTTFPVSFAKAARSGTHSRSPVAVVVEALKYRQATVFAQVVIFETIAAVFPGWYYPVFWIAPIFCLMFVPHKVRMFCEHAEPTLPDRTNTPRLITYLPNRLERILLAPMHINLHAPHHLWPSVPYCNLPRIQALLGASDAIEVRGSYLGFLWQCWRMMPALPASSGMTPVTPPP